MVKLNGYGYGLLLQYPVMIVPELIGSQSQSPCNNYNEDDGKHCPECQLQPAFEGVKP